MEDSGDEDECGGTYYLYGDGFVIERRIEHALPSRAEFIAMLPSMDPRILTMQLEHALATVKVAAIHARRVILDLET